MGDMVAHCLKFVTIPYASVTISSWPSLLA